MWWIVRLQLTRCNSLVSGSSFFSWIRVNNIQCITDIVNHLFEGCVVCVAGVSSKQKSRIKSLVEKRDGLFDGHMDIDTCSHLVACKPEGTHNLSLYIYHCKITLLFSLLNLGNDFETAVICETMFTVRPEWIFKSVALGALQPEQDYPVLPPESKHAAICMCIVRTLLFYTGERQPRRVSSLNGKLIHLL